MVNLRDQIKVTIGQMSHSGSFESLCDYEKRIRYVKPSTQLNKLFKVIEIAKEDQADFVVLPELFLPNKYLFTHIRSICNENTFVIIGGLEYGPPQIDEYDKHTLLQNNAFIAIPAHMNKNQQMMDTFKRNRCSIIKVSKILPAEEEKKELNKRKYQFHTGNKIYVFKSSVLGNWVVLICSDFMNLPIHNLLQANVHTLFVVAYNKDVNAYASMADALQRLLMCNVVICNTGYYGSSLANSPWRDSHKRDVVRVTGNHVDVAVTISLPIKYIDKAHNGITDDEQGKQIMIKTPPDFGKFTLRASQKDNLGD